MLAEMLFMLFLISVPHVLYLLQQAVDKRVYCYFPVKDSVGQIRDGIKSRMNGDSALMNNEEPCAVFSFKCRPSQWHIVCLSFHRSTQDFWKYCDPFILGYTSLPQSPVLMNHVIFHSQLYIHPHGACVPSIRVQEWPYLSQMPKPTYMF